MKHLPKSLFTFLITVTLTAWGATRASASNIAQDQIHLDTTYDNGWSSGQNGGLGFGPWTLSTTSNDPSQNGFYVGSSTNNGGGGSGIDTGHYTYPPTDPDFASWGLYANSGATAVAYRMLTGGSLGVGQAISLLMDNGYVGAGGYVGFVLRTGNDTTNKNDRERFEFFFAGPSPTNEPNTISYHVVDASGVRDVNANLALGESPAYFTDAGISISFTLTGSNTYQLFVAARSFNNGGSGPIDSTEDFGNGLTITGTLAGVSGSAIDSMALYNQNAGAGAPNDLFFNQLIVFPRVAVYNLAVDNAANPDYLSGWPNGSDDGIGWGSGWVLTSSGTNSGFFVGSSTDNGYGDLDGDGDIDVPKVDGSSWGLFANSGQSAVAQRYFSSPLSAGQSFAIDFDNGFIDTGTTGSPDSVSFSLLDDEPNVGPGTPFTFIFTGGGTNYQYIDGSAPFVHDTGIPFTSEGLHIIVTLTGPTTYMASITPLATGSNTVISGTLSGTPNALQYIDRFSVVNSNAGSGPSYDLFINNIAVAPAAQLTGFQILGGTNAAISFSPSPILQNAVQMRDDLLSGSWSDIVSNITGTTNIFQCNDWFAPGQPKRFYRIRSSY